MCAYRQDLPILFKTPTLKHNCRSSLSHYINFEHQCGYDQAMGSSAVYKIRDCVDKTWIIWPAPLWGLLVAMKMATCYANAMARGSYSTERSSMSGPIGAVMSELKHVWLLKPFLIFF